MKPKILTTVLLMLITLAGYGQITFDFSSRTEIDVEELKSKLQPIRNGDFVIFKIDNINTFRYKVELAGRNIDYITQVPSELQTLFRLPSEEANKDLDLTEQGAANAAANAGAMLSIAKTADKDLNKEKSNAVLDIVKIENREKFKETMETLSENCEEYAKSFEKIANIKFQRMLMINLSKQKWSDFEEMEEQLPSELSESTMKKDYLEFVKLYVEVEMLYEKALIQAKELASEEDKKSIEIASKEIGSGYHKIEETTFLKLIEDVITLQRALRNENYFEVVSPPIQMLGDFVEFKVSVKPTRVNDLMPFEPATEFKLAVPGKGGWRADFSVGPVLSYGTGARDESFFLNRNVLINGDRVPVGIDTVGVLTKRSESDRLRPGIAAMIHAYSRSGKPASLGWMLGVGLDFESFDDTNISLYTGPTLIIGRKQKFMVSAGMSYHKVDRLKEEYNLEQNYSVNDIDIASVTQKFIKPSFFIGLSYAISSKIEIN